jgi:undecaprenyl-diphosphatase
MLFDVGEPSLTLSVILHGGTLVATAIVLRGRLREIATALLGAARSPSSLASTAAGRDALFVLVASIPTGIIGLLARDAVADWVRSPLVVAVGFFLTAGVLVSSRWAPSGRMAHPTFGGAILAGVIQGIAVLPGVSRSGSTIAVALWLGVRPDRAFELSMLMSLPAVLGAVLLELGPAMSSPGGGVSMLLGAVAAFGVGLGALLLLRHSVARGYFAWFSLWVLPLALATLALAWASPVSM